MVSHKEVIIFDGDDTLWRTQELYDSAKTEFVELMGKQGFYHENIIEILDKLDAERVKVSKFSKTRFYESMLVVYAIFCGKYNRDWDSHIELRIRELGNGIFAPTKLYEDTMSTLEMLSKSFNLILFTNGDEEVQRKKINFLGQKFKSYFHRVYIPEIKNEEEFMRIKDDLKIPVEKIWVVGNSVKSDINPALKLGMKVILIPRGTWKYEESKPVSNDVVIVHSLSDAAKTILKKHFDN